MVEAEITPPRIFNVTDAEQGEAEPDLSFSINPPALYLPP